MDTAQNSVPADQFLILTPRLILLPTPIAVSLSAYRKLYVELYADANFCGMGFGPHFLPRKWSDDEAREMITTRDIQRSWEKYSIGNFAVALRDQPDEFNIGVLKGKPFEDFVGPDMALFEDVNLKWVGYAGIRDATTTSLPHRGVADTALPPWQEMVEVLYGTSPECWGKGIAKEAAEAVMKWATKERGVRRFIAETERDNQRSGRVLQKLGFSHSGTDYWKEPSEVEWECVVR
ncbi:hypothetical protein N7478_001098 [Penicillium angulare]|uniref:uncharacterized protein n=1 Tax=Penicillium angulare TaxID=116970 RepID=UPI0025419E47|nr:uncharacterized protein N7478_001098 [Penicillium angulare]KAJ5291847.1 hypothetical protein N7478_001098 [Penicillium angulare]